MSEEGQPAAEVPASLLGRLSEELVDLVARVAPSVVALNGAGRVSSSWGSGFLVDGVGHVVTNFHVVDGITGPVEAILHGGAHCTAAMVGMDAITDLAVVRLETPPPDHLELRPEPARLGELCIGLGSPFGIYPESVSLGVVSGVSRRIIQENSERPLENAIQTDAAINPGNSGGPLMDVSGRVLGVNKSVDSRGTGIGFAVPAETVRWVVPEIQANGRVERAALGATVVRHTVTVNGGQLTGLAVTRLAASAAAGSAEGGLAVDDVILKVAGEPVDEASDLYRILTKDRIGKPTAVQVVRNGTVTDLTITPTRLGG
jgi:serine protease Do